VSELCCVSVCSAVAVVIQRVGLNDVTVAVDGSLYRFHPHFKQLMTRKISQLLPEHMQVYRHTHTHAHTHTHTHTHRPVIVRVTCLRYLLLQCTVATSIVHSKLDYCKSLYYSLPKSQITRLRQIENSLAHAVVNAPKSCQITPVLCSLHWLKITERIQYKLLSLTYKVLTTNQPPYLHHLTSVQPPRSTRSSSLVTLARPPTSCSLYV